MTVTVPLVADVMLASNKAFARLLLVVVVDLVSSVYLTVLP